MSVKKVLSGSLGLALAANLLTPAAYAAEESVSEPLVMDLLNYAEAAEQIIPELPEALTKVDPTLLRIFLFNERRRPETDKLDLLVENRLHELLLPLRRFKLIESREAKVRRVVSTPTALQVSTTIESMERMRQMAKEIGAEGVLMYAPFVTNQVVMVHLKLVRATDGEIVWTHRYSYDYNTVRQVAILKAKAEEEQRKAEAARLEAIERRNRDNGVYVYGGVTGFSADRAAAAPGGAARHADLSLSAGLMLLRNTYFWENLAVGIDTEYLQAGGVDGSLYYGMVNVSPLLFLRLDPLFLGKNGLGVVNLYGGPGMAFSLSEPLKQPAVGKFGFLVRFTPDLFMNLGFTYVPSQALRMPQVSSLAETMTYGGMTYHATFGMAFR